MVNRSGHNVTFGWEVVQVVITSFLHMFKFPLQVQFLAAFLTPLQSQVEWKKVAEGTVQST